MQWSTRAPPASRRWDHFPPCTCATCAGPTVASDKMLVSAVSREPRRNPMKFPARTVLLIVAIMMGGCTAEPTSLAPPSKSERRPVSVDGSPSNNPPIVRTAGIFPASVSLEATLQVDIQGEDKDGDAIHYQYQWIVNGLPVPDGTGPQFLTAQLKKGDEIGVELIPSDGKVNGAAFKTASVMVGNTAPQIDEIHMEPAPVHRGESIKARAVARDPDREPVDHAYKGFWNG